MYNKYTKLYEEYINNPIDNVKNIRYFIYENKLAYKNLDILEKIYKKLKNNNYNYVKLTSNGSTKTKLTDYKWGPNFRIICNLIWNHMHRFYDIKHRLYLRICSTKSHINIIETQSEGNSFYLNPYNDLKEFCHLKNVCYICTPMTLHELLRHNSFIDLIKNTASVISTTETDNSYFDFSILKELGIPYVNQMRSWKEGTAFYTCPYGIMHWMENLFYCTEDNKIIDLFNFYNTWWNNENSNPDNIYPLENEFHLCKCGEYFRQFNFNPCIITGFINYKGERIDMTPIIYKLNKIIDNYKFLQIIQLKEKNFFNVHIDNTDNENDIKTIINFIKNDIYLENKVKINLITEKFSIGIREKKFCFYSFCNI